MSSWLLQNDLWTNPKPLLKKLAGNKHVMCHKNQSIAQLFTGQGEEVTDKKMVEIPLKMAGGDHKGGLCQQ